MKFITDSNLGKLAKWLRVLGYDTVYDRGAIDRSLLERGAKEGRVVLTRRRDMALRNFRGRMVVVRAEKVADQLLEIAGTLSLKPDHDQLFTICTGCNEILREVSKAAVKERVPEYVFQTQETFRVCPRCNAIYWSGTHRAEMISFIERHNLTGRL